MIPFDEKTVIRTPRNSNVHKRNDSSEHDLSECCWICGKYIKEEKRIVWVHTIYGSDLMPIGMECPSNSDTGFYPLGSECKKLIPKDYIFSGTYQDILGSS